MQKKKTLQTTWLSKYNNYFIIILFYFYFK